MNPATLRERERESERIFTHCVRVAHALSCCPSLSLTFARWLNGRRCLISTYTQSFVEFSIEFIVYLVKRVRSLALFYSVGLCVRCNAFAIAIAITVANVVASYLAVCSVLLNFAMLLLVVRFYVEYVCVCVRFFLDGLFLFWALWTLALTFPCVLWIIRIALLNVCFVQNYGLNEKFITGTGDDSRWYKWK